jgi:hypothetical protein
MSYRIARDARHALAARIAEAQVDLVRARLIRRGFPHL